MEKTTLEKFENLKKLYPTWTGVGGLFGAINEDHSGVKLFAEYCLQKKKENGNKLPISEYIIYCNDFSGYAKEKSEKPGNEKYKTLIPKIEMMIRKGEMTSENLNLFAEMFDDLKLLEPTTIEKYLPLSYENLLKGAYSENPVTPVPEGKILQGGGDKEGILRGEMKPPEEKVETTEKKTENPEENTKEINANTKETVTATSEYASSATAETENQKAEGEKKPEKSEKQETPEIPTLITKPEIKEEKAPKTMKITTQEKIGTKIPEGKGEGKEIFEKLRNTTGKETRTIGKTVQKPAAQTQLVRPQTKIIPLPEGLRTTASQQQVSPKMTTSEPNLRTLGEEKRAEEDLFDRITKPKPHISGGMKIAKRTGKILAGAVGGGISMAMIGGGDSAGATVLEVFKNLF